MTFSQAIQFLYSLRWYGTKLGLDNAFRLAGLAGNPHHRLRFIHVAGTNGKGSTCAMIESICRAAGLRVGLFTSPHLVAFGERIQVNRRLLSEADTVRLVSGMQSLLRHFPAENHPTFFEVVTVMALQYFLEQQCDLVVWETGLGGRLDATNIVTPLASVITNIQFDHQQWLGETLAGIAAEKAGIIKPGIPVVTAVRTPEPLAVIQETARRLQAPLTQVPASAAREAPLDRMELPLLGDHQKMNAAVALATLRVLASQLPASPAAIRDGLTRLHWPGRLQLVTRPSGQRVLLDGAHNPGGAEILAQALRQYFANAQPTLVLGILQDKDWPEMCRLLAPLARRILLVPVPNERTAEPHALAGVCAKANPPAQVLELSGLAGALAEAASDEFVVIAGSLYLIGEAMELLHLSAAPEPNERKLNEWGPPRNPPPK